jgi:hypothetical protein
MPKVESITGRSDSMRAMAESGPTSSNALDSHVNTLGNCRDEMEVTPENGRSNWGKWEGDRYLRKKIKKMPHEFILKSPISV